jgi:hypothetical protein
MKSTTISARLLPLAVAPALGAALLAAFVSAAGARTVMPPVQTSGAAKFVSGGIGADEAAAMRRAAARYELELVFAVRDPASRGDFLASVPVTIRNATGQDVVNTTAQGPYLLANLPDGTYTVTATDNGVAKRQLVHITHGAHQNVIFEW